MRMLSLWFYLSTNDMTCFFMLSSGRKGERLRDGVHIAILGRPNVGKSSLINYLSHRPVAIVSPIEGTTRDIVESTLDINGYPVIIVDTAGLRFLILIQFADLFLFK